VPVMQCKRSRDGDSAIRHRSANAAWRLFVLRRAAVDCILADDWQPWTACSSRCGLGTRRRSRRIVRAASNGGRPCPSTVQKGICYGSGCKFARAHGRVQMQGTALRAVDEMDGKDKIIEVASVRRSFVDESKSLIARSRWLTVLNVG